MADRRLLAKDIPAYITALETELEAEKKKVIELEQEFKLFLEETTNSLKAVREGFDEAQQILQMVADYNGPMLRAEPFFDMHQEATKFLGVEPSWRRPDA